MTITNKTKEKLTLFLFLGPSIAGFSLFFFAPFLGAIYYSLIDGSSESHFVGLENYINIMSNNVFTRAMFNTIFFTIICVPINMGISLILALLLNLRIPYRNIFRTIFISPLVVPVASVILVWHILFDYSGTINAVLSNLGLFKVDWMNSEWARIVVLILYLWKNVGYNIILFLAGLQCIPEEYYDSARIDGANLWHKFKNITLVYLTPTSFFVFIMSIINSFKVFRETYLISGEYPHTSIYMLQHYMNNMFRSLDYQKLTTAALITAFIIYLLVVILFRFERRISASLK